TSGLMAAGAMSDISSIDSSDLTAEMYKGGPVIRYRKGGVIQRYAAGGDTDEDLLSEDGGTDTDDPTASAYWDQAQVNSLTNNSDPSRVPDLPTSIVNREEAGQQGQAPIQAPPLEPANIESAIAPADQPTTEQSPTEQPEQPAAPTEQPTEQPTEGSQRDIPPGSVQVAGPGGWGSAGYRDLTNISSPRVGGMGGMGRGYGYSVRGSSTLTGGGRRSLSPAITGGNPLYLPGGIADNDANHLGLAPINNTDGSPGVWLYNMVDNGIRA